MQGLGVVHAGGLGHTAAGLSGGRPQQDRILGAELPVRLNDRFQNGALAGAGASGDDGQIVPKHHLHTLGLPGGQFDPQPVFDLFHDWSKLNRLRHLQKHLDRLAGRLALLGEHMGQVDIALVGHHHVGHDHILQLLLHLLAV